MGTIFGREPAAIAAFLGIAINLAITFGLKLSVEQVALINALVVAGLALIVRQGSTSIVAPKLAQGTTVEVVTPEGKPNELTVL
jgi:hypothetical protein